MTISSTSSRYDKPKPFSPCLLLLLPYELRHQIYNASLAASNPIDPHNKRKASFSPSLLATCKQIHDEATPILYRENEFILHNIPRDAQWLDEIGARNVSILKRVQFFVDEGPIVMTEFGGVANDGQEQRLRALLRRLTRDAKGLRYLRVHLAGLGEKDYECYECDEEGYGMQPRWGWGEDRQFMLELGRMSGLTELVLEGGFETTWMGYLRKQMGDAVKVL
ncbi:hypothetical protein EMPG_11510 [Blastomyces silverae]|uniref:F-box domain-containing protein n=1 Tax=Blastomyces silverae TaxID=2060906 RepID=A0A0H1BWV0_9EURO|nr:hypothetical protein EMPG_11510 [Blastomyces silverae]